MPDIQQSYRGHNDAIVKQYELSEEQVINELDAFLAHKIPKRIEDISHMRVHHF